VVGGEVDQVAGHTILAMTRAWLAGAFVVVGVGIIAGLGWAFLAAAVVVYLTPVPQRVVGAARWAAGQAGRSWRWVLTGRHQVAMTATPAALVLVPVGAGVVAGIGWALITAGVLVLGLALLLGWDRDPRPVP
jgi:hypothetical protein